MILRRVRGRSMLPGLSPGQIVVAWQRQVRVGDVVIARQMEREVVKRVSKITAPVFLPPTRGATLSRWLTSTAIVQEERYYLVGDNSLESTDSREFGTIARQSILGVVMIKFAVAVSPPKLKNQRDVWYGYVAAAVMVGFALLHLFRIDEWLPAIQNWHLVGGTTMSTAIAVLIIVGEVLAVPFLLRMRLSRSAQIASGALAFLVPWAWVLIQLWLVGTAYSSYQLGTYSDFGLTLQWQLLILDLLWLAGNSYVLGRFGYSSLLPARLLPGNRGKRLSKRRK